MRKSYIRKYFLFTQIFFLSLFIVSCSTTKNTKYFQDIPDSGLLKTIPAAVYVEPKIQVDDILSITVQTLDPLATQSINMGNIPVSTSAQFGSSGSSGAMGLSQLATASAGAGQAQQSAGYLVDKSGNVDIPILGKVHAAGFSTSALRDIIDTIASRYYKNPTVIVRYANFKISIEGEVQRPGIYIMPNERVGLLDALAMAGDLTIYGKRDNVLLIREDADGTKIPYRVNLKRSDIMSAPYYYLRQNDIIYVEPSKAKAAATDATQARTYTIIGSILTVLIVLLTRVN